MDDEQLTGNMCQQVLTQLYLSPCPTLQLKNENMIMCCTPGRDNCVSIFGGYLSRAFSKNSHLNGSSLYEVDLKVAFISEVKKRQNWIRKEKK